MNVEYLVLSEEEKRNCLENFKKNDDRGPDESDLHVTKRAYSKS
jgi:hypothetical protein